MEEKGKEIKDIHIFSVYYTVYNHLTCYYYLYCALQGKQVVSAFNSDEHCNNNYSKQMLILTPTLLFISCQI